LPFPYCRELFRSLYILFLAIDDSPTCGLVRHVAFLVGFASLFLSPTPLPDWFYRIGYFRLFPHIFIRTTRELGFFPRPFEQEGCLDDWEICFLPFFFLELMKDLPLAARLGDEFCLPLLTMYGCPLPVVPEFCPSKVVPAP